MVVRSNWLESCTNLQFYAHHQGTNNCFLHVHFLLVIVKFWVRELLLTILVLIKQAYYLPETEYVHWARSHPVRTLQNFHLPIDTM